VARAHRLGPTIREETFPRSEKICKIDRWLALEESLLDSKVVTSVGSGFQPLA